MMWLGLIGGMVVGGVLWGAPGAIVLGFFGWLTGLIIKSHQRGPSTPVTPAAAKPVAARETLEDRVQRLERVVAQLQARLGEGRVEQAEPVTVPLEPEAAASEMLPEPPTVEPPPPLTQPPAPAPAPVPPTPNPFWAWLTGGNTIARVGLLILFIGLAFLLKYAAEHSLFPPELRVALVAAAGVGLLGLGWKLRESRPAYALGMQGAGVAVLYLTTFGALRIWHLLPAPVAFGMLAVIAIFSAIIAVRQDSMALAVMGAGGGFLAPVLASSGGGSHVMLFSYYLLLNLGIAAIAWHKAWRGLNLVGFLFTFFIGLAWGAKFYQPAYLESVEPFLIAFFLLYVAIAILFARRQSPQLKHFVDGTIVFGTPLAAIGLQAALVNEIEMALAYSSMALAAIYLALAAYLRRWEQEGLDLLSRAFVALGIVFASAAVPLALDARWTSAAWALEGAAIVWFGVRQKRPLARAFGELLQVLAAFFYLDSYHRDASAIPLLDAPFLGAMLVAGAGLWTWRLLANAGEAVSRVERGLVKLVFAWGLLWWFFAANHEITTFAPREVTLNAHVILLAVTAWLLAEGGVRRNWKEAAWTTRLLLPALALFAFVSLAGHNHPFAYFGWIAWPLAITAHLWVLRRVDFADSPGVEKALHSAGVVMVAALGAKELHWAANEYTAFHSAWSVASVAVVPALLMLASASRAAESRWPVSENGRAYRSIANAVLAAGLIVWSLYANATHDGTSTPLPYFPLLNALDLAHGLVGIALVAAFFAQRRHEDEGMALSGPRAIKIAGVVTFVWLNGVLLRTLHHWADVPYNMIGVMNSVLAQAALSVFWSVLALALMVYATRSAQRALWMVGAALMAVVVVKLFLIDLSHVAGIERIVSFIAVGVLMLVIGYFSPVPPHRPEEPQ